MQGGLYLQINFVLVEKEREREVGVHCWQSCCVLTVVISTKCGCGFGPFILNGSYLKLITSWNIVEYGYLFFDSVIYGNLKAWVTFSLYLVNFLDELAVNWSHGEGGIRIYLYKVLLVKRER